MTVCYNQITYMERDAVMLGSQKQNNEKNNNERKTMYYNRYFYT